MEPEHDLGPAKNTRQVEALTRQFALKPPESKRRLKAVPLPPTTLANLSQSLPAAREAGRFLTAPRYEAYFRGGKLAQTTKLGNLSSVQHNGEHIDEVVKLRHLRLSPAQFANLAFSILTVVVGQEHMARIDRQLAALRATVDEIAAMLEDDLAASVRALAGPMRRLGAGGGDLGITQATAEAWAHDLRRVRWRLIPKLERLAGVIKPADRWSWGGCVNDLTVGAKQLLEARRLVEMLAACDGMLTRLAVDADVIWALDDIDGTLPATLGRPVAAAARALLASTDTFRLNIESEVVARTAERDSKIGNALTDYELLLEAIEHRTVLRELSEALLDQQREFCLIIEHGQAVSFAEVQSATASTAA